MADTYDVDSLKAMGLTDEAIAELLAFDLTKYQTDYQANQKAYEDAMARGLTAAQATGLSDEYVAVNDPGYNDLIPGMNAQIMGNLGMIPTQYDYAPVFNLKGDQDYENYNFVPVPGEKYRLLDNNTGQVIGYATNAAEAKGLVEAANAISDKMGGNANWALQKESSWSDGKGNMTTGYSDVYTNEKTGTMNDLSMLIQAAGVMAMAGAGIAALTTQAATAAGAGAASAGTGAGAAGIGAGATAAEAGSLATGALASTASNVTAIANIAASQAAAAGLSQASASLLTQVGMGALRGGITSAALGGDPIEGAITGGFASLGSTVVGPLIDSVKGAGEIATNLGASVGSGIGTTVAGLTLGYDVDDAFMSGLVSGAAQYVSTEIADEIAERRLESAEKKIEGQLDKINGVLSSADKISAADFEFAKNLSDEIIVNAPGIAKEYARNAVSEYLSDLATELAKTGSKTETDTKATTDTTAIDNGGVTQTGDTTITGGSGTDTTAGATGNTLAGLGNLTTGDTTITGGSGADTTTGGTTGDTLAGLGNLTTGDTTITGGSGADTTKGGATDDTLAGLGNLTTGDITVTATTSPPTTGEPTVIPTTYIPPTDITVTATTSPPTTGEPTVIPTYIPPTDITVTATTSPPTTGEPTVIPTTYIPPTDITVTATTSPPTTGEPTVIPTYIPPTDITVTATTSPPTTARPTTAPPTIFDTYNPTTYIPPTDITVTATTTPPTTGEPTVIPTTFEPTKPPPTTGEPTKPPPTWTPKDWVMLGLAVPNLINRIVGKGEDVGTITPDQSRVNYNPLNRQRGIGSFDPFTYGQAGPGYQTAEFEFFKPYSAAQPTQQYTPTTVNWTPGADIYEYTPEEFATMQQNANAQYNERSASFNNYQQMLAKQVESGALTLDQALAEARSYAEPFGGAIIPQKAAGGYIGYRNGGSAMTSLRNMSDQDLIEKFTSDENNSAVINEVNKRIRAKLLDRFNGDDAAANLFLRETNAPLDILKGYADGGEADDDMVKHLMEYRKGRGHNGPGPVRGIGSGQEDKIPAWLSDGEYVWSAQDVADLGDGSTDEGVRRLDKMRQMVRKQAGRKDVKKIAKPQKGIDQMLKAVGGKV